MQQQIKNKSGWQHFHYWYTTALQGVFSTPTMKHSKAPCSLHSTVGWSWCSTKNTSAQQTWSCAKGRVSEMFSAFIHMVIKKIIIMAWCLMSHWSTEIKINSLLCLHDFILDYKKWSERRGFECNGFIHLDVSNKTVPIPIIVWEIDVRTH